MKLLHAFLRALGRLPVPAQLGLPLVAFGALLWLAGESARASLLQVFEDDPKVLAVFKREGLRDWILNSATLAQTVASIFAALGIAAWIPWRPVLFLIRNAYIVVLDVCAYYTFLVVLTVSTLAATSTAIEGLEPNPDRQFAWYCTYLLPALIVAIFAIRLGLNAFRRTAANYFDRTQSETLDIGDRLVAGLNSWLSERRTRSVGASVAVHFGILVLPILLSLLGAVTPYLLPHGKGSPDAGGGAKKQTAGKESREKKMVKVRLNATKKPARTTKNLKGVIFSPDAGRKVTATAHADAMMEELDQLTELTYKADTNIVVGGTGTGTGGGTGPGNKAGGIGKGGVGPGGWPDGMKNSLIRFIRLEYNGPDWDDGMAANVNADGNFLAAFNKITGFRCAAKGESHPVRFLAKYDKGVAPPFVYLTGSGGINMSANDYKILREYLLEGGMLFADCGSPEWDRSFRSMVASLLPGKNLVTISDDDPLFQAPYVFPNGAPPLWHHGGTKAMGVKHNGRWIVFYHPGDINDAWKTGHSGLSPEKAQGAFDLGVNVLYYSFTKYLEMTAKKR